MQCQAVASRGLAAATRSRGSCHRRCVAPRAAIVGVDLGTSNSAISAIKEGGDGPAARVLRNAQGSASVPSLVAIAQDGRVLVGHEVMDPPEGYATTYSSGSQQGAVPIPLTDTFHSFKRLMGKRASEVTGEAARLGYSIGEGDRGEAMAYSPALDDMLTPVELSVYVLQHLRQVAEGELGEAVTGAVVTVPAHFNQAQQGATHTAATQAGFGEVQLLQEPVAAALAYGINGGTDGDTVLVFDVGGGTFDVSVLQAFEGIMEVLGTAGDSNLGGNDFDALLADWLLEECAALGLSVGRNSSSSDSGSSGGNGSSSNGSNGSSSSSSSSVENGSSALAPVFAWQSREEQREWARRAAEVAKITLSTSKVAEVALPGGAALTLTRRQFEERTSRLFQLMANVLEALGDALFVQWAERPSNAIPGQASSSAGGSSSNEAGGKAGSSNGSNGSSGSKGSSGGSGGSSSGSGDSGGSKPRDKWAPPPRRITQVALVGQLTRLPSVQHFVQRITGIAPSMTVDPAEAVALGAAIHAGILLGKVSQVEIMDGSFVQDLHSRATGFSGWQP